MRKIFKKIAGFAKKDEEYDENTDEDVEYEEKEVAEEEAEEDEEVSEEDAEENDEEWLGEDYEEGQLSIDVYQTPNDLIIQSTIAGVKPDDIDISINNDMLTIRGKREAQKKIKNEDYLYRECYWGSFSRSIILPIEVEADKIEATLENGVLTVVLPKAKNAKQISIKVKEK